MPQGSMEPISIWNKSFCINYIMLKISPRREHKCTCPFSKEEGENMKTNLSKCSHCFQRYKEILLVTIMLSTKKLKYMVKYENTVSQLHAQPSYEELKGEKYLTLNALRTRKKKCTGSIIFNQYKLLPISSVCFFIFP